MVLLTNSEISIFRREYGTIKEKTGVKCMLKRDGGKQLKMTFLTLEDLMPEKHFLRDLERCVDFSFIYDIVEPLYARVGRPSIDPVLLALFGCLLRGMTFRHLCRCNTRYICEFPIWCPTFSS